MCYIRKWLLHLFRWLLHFSIRSTLTLGPAHWGLVPLIFRWTVYFPEEENQACNQCRQGFFSLSQPPQEPKWEGAVQEPVPSVEKVPPLKERQLGLARPQWHCDIGAEGTAFGPILPSFPFGTWPPRVIGDSPPESGESDSAFGPPVFSLGGEPSLEGNYSWPVLPIVYLARWPAAGAMAAFLSLIYNSFFILL